MVVYLAVLRAFVEGKIVGLYGLRTAAYMVYRFRSLWQRIAVTCERIMHIYTHEMSKIGSVYVHI